MLDREPNNHETDIDKAPGHSAGVAPAPVTPAVPAALFQPPQVLFQPPVPVAAPTAGARDSGSRDSGDRESGARDSGDRAADDRPEADAEPGGRTASRRTRSRSRRVRDAVPDDDLFTTEPADAPSAVAEADPADGGAAGVTEPDDGDESTSSRRRRRRNTRTRGRTEATADAAFAEDDADGQSAADDSASDDADTDADGDGESAGGEGGASGRRRRRKRRRGSGDSETLSPDDPPDTVVHVREAHNPVDEVRAIKGSTRLEAKRQRRREGRESGRRRPPVVTESEFLARRESVERTMVVRQRGDRTQIAVLEDGVLVEHYVNRTTHASYVGNVYLGKVQNVLPSMEAAFVDIGKGRNAVLYAGEVNFDASGLEGQPRRIESALKPGQSVIVQVTKDPVGHKGARLTSQVSLPGRYLVYVPSASMTGISRKLPDTERTRLKQILKKVTPENAGVIVRTAAEGAAEAELDRDITRLAAQWESIEKKAKTATAPALLYGEPDLTVRVVRDVFNEDFHQLIVSGDEGWEIIDEYVKYVAPHLADRISRWDADDDPADDVFAEYRIDEQLAKALDRKVWLPSGGSLVIDRTEAMTVIDVNTGKFTGQGGNLEETVTRNNLEAAEEIVRQLRLRDIGGIIVIDFIDMVLESNRELVLRRLLECLARDRTKHQVAEVTSLGLVQMTRKRVGAGLIEAFSTPCECCNGRGVIVTLDAPPEQAHRASAGTVHRPVPAPPAHAVAGGAALAPANGNGSGNGNGRGQGNGPASARGGYGNGRRTRRDSGSYQDTLPPLETETAAQADTAGSVQAAEVQADTVQVSPVSASPVPVSTAQADAANGAPSGNGTGTDANGGRRTRRGTTSAGTAFATAVLVEDSPALVPVVTTVTEPAPSAYATAVTGTPATEHEDPPVRRTRTRSAGSAVARVTVVTDPEPAPAPEPTPVPDAAAAAAAADTLAPAPGTTEAPAPVAEAPAQSTDSLAPSTEAAETEAAAEAVPATEALEEAAPATEAIAEVALSTEAREEAAPAAEALAQPTEAAEATAAATPAAEAATEPEPETATTSLSEPTLVSANVFDAPATAPAEAVAAPAEEAQTEQAETEEPPAEVPDAEVAAPDAAAEPAAEVPTPEASSEAPEADDAGESTTTTDEPSANAEGDSPNWA